MSPQSIVFGWALSQAWINSRLYMWQLCTQNISQKGAKYLRDRKQPHQETKWRFPIFAEEFNSDKKILKNYFYLRQTPGQQTSSGSA